MAFKRFNPILIILIISLVITSMALGVSVYTSKFHAAVIFGLLAGFETLSLFLRFTWTFREVLFFFKALENDDTSIRYPSDHRNRLIDELHGYLNNLNNIFREMKVNNEIREQYFSRILENLSSGLMVISVTGHINHINREALRLLNIPRLTHLKALAEIDQQLYSTIKNLQSLEKSEITLQDQTLGISRVLGLQAVLVNLKGEDVRIISMQDLSLEMERKEIDDWIRLIRVMSHEIMNSLAPITSISTTLKEVWTEGGGGDAVQSELKIGQTLKGLDAIAEQSAGLTTFFESYRILSRVPDPVLGEIFLCNMFEKVETLVIHQKEYYSIPVVFKCEDPTLTIMADEQMIIQVMLNLIKNAAQALKETREPMIRVEAVEIDGNRRLLTVSDNGPGIPVEISEEIFMPFFTTREKGTGVGLSYSRQVMSLNKGKIEYESVPGKTQFRLVF